MHTLRLAGWVIGVVLAGACSSPDSDDPGGGGSAPTTAASTTGGVGGSTTSSASGGSTGSGTPLTCGQPVSDLDGECDLLSQDCEPGFWCNVVNNERKCVPYYEASKGKNETCASNSECKPGLICVNAKCTPFCCPETHEPCDGGICDSSVTFGTGFAMVCSYHPICTLFEGDCADGTYCHPALFDDALAVCDPPSPNPVAENEECVYRNDCGESQLCNKNPPDQNGTKGICRHLCKVSNWEALTPGTGGCETDRSCTEVNAGAFEDLGICQP